MHIKHEGRHLNLRKLLNRVGETRKMNCGTECTIIKYVNASDITVRFQNGEICEHREYKDFIHGRIRQPDLSYSVYYSNNRVAKNRVGETRIMNCGMKCTIIEYVKSSDITVQFADGSICKHMNYSNYVKGNIANPNIPTSNTISMNEYIMSYYLNKLNFFKASRGTLKKYGFEQMELDVFNESAKIGIEYDGEIHKIYKNNDYRKDMVCKKAGITLFRIREKMDSVSNYSTSFTLSTTVPFSKEYEYVLQNLCDVLTKFGFDQIIIDFQKDKDIIISSFREQYPNSLVNKRVGETKRMNCGMKCTIIKYVSAKDITVQFSDGVVVNNRSYKEFKKCSINHPKLAKISYAYKQLANERIGEIRTMNCGMEAKIIRYNNSHDIDIEFYDGLILTNRTYKDFRGGLISNPTIMNTTKSNKRIGESRKMNCGMYCTIIEYNSCNDLTVRFEDGIILKNRTYDSFKLGTIKNPNIPLNHYRNNEMNAKLCKSRIGETRLMNCGIECTIIEYISSTNITVRFRDNSIVANRSYKEFTKGNIKSPNVKIQQSKSNERIGETKRMNCGSICTIIAYKSNRDITVRFEDGTIIEHRFYKEFTLGSIRKQSVKKTA